MKKIILTLFLIIGIVAGAKNPAPNGESLNYRVMYKWGLINKKAGTVNLKVRYGSNDSFSALLTARSEKWADKVYMVRDTLIGNMSLSTCEPTLYEKITHEGGEYKHDMITYKRSGGKTTGHCVRNQQKKPGKPMTTRELTLESNDLTLDMLSAFYYMRSIKYEQMSPGKSLKLTVFSGKRKETLTITYHGKANINVDNKAYSTFHITFKFTGDGGKKTSDDMDAWISTDTARVPIKLEGNLPVGKVQCYLM